MACASTAGFHHGSIRKTREASVRLSATPPACHTRPPAAPALLTNHQSLRHNPFRISAPTLRDTRKTVISGMVMNALMMPSRAMDDMVPSSLTQRKPAFCRRHSIRSRKLTYCENTIDLMVSPCSRSLVSSSSSASILVLGVALPAPARQRPSGPQARTSVQTDNAPAPPAVHVDAGQDGLAPSGLLAGRWLPRRLVQVDRQPPAYWQSADNTHDQHSAARTDQRALSTRAHSRLGFITHRKQTGQSTASLTALPR